MESTTWIIALLAVALALLAGYWISKSRSGRKLAELETANTTSTARAAELQQTIADLRQRESQAIANRDGLTEELRLLREELRSVSEERGQYKADAARVDEVRDAVAEREADLSRLQAHITELEREKAEALTEANAAAKRADEVIAAERRALQETVAAKDQQIDKLSEFISSARETLTMEFKAVSADAIKEASSQLVRVTDGIIEKHGEKSASDVETRKLEIEKLLQPVAETIRRLDGHVEEGEKSRRSAQAVLEKEIERLAGASESLVNAFTRPVVKGASGERMLETVLEASCLPRELYELQHYTEGEQGGARTDAVVKLPGGRQLVIDSKNLMDSYLAIDRAETHDEKHEALREHSKALEQHIKLLSSKDYSTRYGGFDFVILFIPSESMYHEAVAHNPDLLRFARDRQVYIANPMTLLSLLAALQCLCRQEKQNLYAAEIATAGQDLYAEIGRFAENMSKLGKRIGQTVEAYNSAVPGLDRYILAKSRRLSELGASTNRGAEVPALLDATTRGFASRELREQTDALALV